MKKMIRRVLLTALCLLIWLPLLVMAGNSLMSKGEMIDRYASVFGLDQSMVRAAFLPEFPTLAPYIDLLLDSPGFYVMFWNSCFMVLSILAGQALIAFPAAWGFASFEFKGKRVLFFLYILLMVLPFQVTMVPNYLVLKRLGLINRRLAVILPGICAAFPVFLMTKFFESIPKPLLEAARLDGAGELKTFLHIGLPLGKPGMTAAMVLGFLEYWNAIEQPMTFLKEPRLWPLSLYLPQITSDKAGAAWAASVITMIFPVTLFLLGQESLEQGIAVSGIKE